jgi:hypothetical protein
MESRADLAFFDLSATTNLFAMYDRVEIVDIRHISPGAAIQPVSLAIARIHDVVAEAAKQDVSTGSAS